MAKKTLSDKTSESEDSVQNNDDVLNDDDEPYFSDPEEFIDDITGEGKLILFLMTANRSYSVLTESMATYTLQMWHAYLTEKAANIIFQHCCTKLILYVIYKFPEI